MSNSEQCDESFTLTHPSFLRRLCRNMENRQDRHAELVSASETLAVIEMAQRAGYRTVISHRSGKTEDTTISDLAGGANAGQNQDGCHFKNGSGREIQSIDGNRGRPGRASHL